jgi:hypothetical protein
VLETVVPFHAVLELEIKPVPVMVTAVLAEPATAEVGLIDVIAGVGFCTGGVVPPELPPPQPQIRRMKDRRKPKKAHTERFIGGSRVETESI